MNLLTLRISHASPTRLAYSLTSLDPTRRIAGITYESSDNPSIPLLLRDGALEMQDAARSGVSDKLSILGRRYRDILLPETVGVLLDQSPERFLLLDLDEGVVNFPWESLATAGGDLLFQRFFIGRNMRLQGQRPNTDVRPLRAPLVIADPASNLPATLREGEIVRTTLAKHSRGIAYLAGAVGAGEVLGELEKASLFHYAGHSVPNALIVSDGTVTTRDIDNCRKAPFFVFLNSCSPGDQRGWRANGDNIARSLLKAGTHVLISPMTLVDSEIACKVACLFYEQFLSGSPVGQALHIAKTSEAVGAAAGCNYVLYGNPMFSLAQPQHLGKARPNNLKRGIKLALVAIGLGAFVTCFWMVNRKRSGSSPTFNAVHLTQEKSPKNTIDHQSPVENSEAQRSFERGIAYSIGQGVPRDDRMALTWFKKACEAPGAKGQYCGAFGRQQYILASDRGEFGKSLAAFDRAVNKGDLSATADRDALKQYLDRESRIDMLLKEPDSDLNPRDFDIAKTLARRLEMGCPDPTYAGVKYPRSSPLSDASFWETCPPYGLTQRDPQKSTLWLKKIAQLGATAAGQGDPESMAELGAKYEYGQGVAVNYGQAIAWYRKAAEAGSSHACARLSQLYAMGRGTSKDIRAALLWLERAVKNAEGNPGLTESYRMQLEEFRRDWARELKEP